MITYTIFTLFSKASSFTKQLFLLALFITLLPIASFAQQTNFAQSQYAKAKIDISHLAKLEDKASEVVDVTIDRRTLRLALKYFSNSKDPEELKIRDLVAGIEGIYVKVYEFEKENEYAASDYENIHTQLKAPGWIRIAGVRSKKKDSTNVEVSMMTDDDDNLLGLAIIAAEAKQIAVVNIVGTFDPARIRELSGKFKGLPDLDLEGLGIVKKSKEKTKDEEKPKEETKKKDHSDN